MKPKVLINLRRQTTFIYKSDYSPLLRRKALDKIHFKDLPTCEALVPTHFDFWIRWRLRLWLDSGLTVFAEASVDQRRG